MSKKTSYILGILFTIIIGTLLYCYLCNCCHCFPTENNVKEDTNTIVTKPEVEETKEVTRNAFAVSDSKSNFNVNTNDNFNFKTSSFIILDTLSANVTDKVSELKNFLLANPLKTVNITGYYKSDEKNNSAYPNLGLARANAVKNYFVLNGILSKQIDTYSKLNDDIIPDDTNTLFGPLKFGVLTTDASDTSLIDALEKTCDSVRANPLVLHFGSGQAAINLTTEQRKKIADISHCVDKLGVKVQVVGHTDNSGDANNNIVLGQKRADFAKSYLTRNGILEENIETSSKGPNEPIADNTTEEGKAKNRRTVVTIN